MRRMAIGWLAFFSFACGDRSLEDFHRDQLQQEAQVLQRIMGVFEGNLDLFGDQYPLTRLKISVETRSVSAGGGGPVAREQLNLGGKIVIETNDRFSFGFDQAFFNPQTGEFSTSFSITRLNERTIDFKLSGILEGDRLKGQVYATDHIERAGRFDLSRTNENPSALPSKYIPSEARKPPAKEVWYQAESGAIRLIISEIVNRPEEVFINYFSPIKFVDLTVDFSGDVQVSMMNAVWDLQTGSLRGRLIGSAPGLPLINITLNCQGFPEPNRIETLSCRYTAAHTGRSMDLTFERAKGTAP